MTTTQLDVNTCDKMCGLHSYSLLSGNVHALPLEFLVNCARSILGFMCRENISYTCYISKKKSFIRCDGTLVLSFDVDTKGKSHIVSDDIFKFHGRFATEMLLDWHMSRTAWIMQHPEANTSVVNSVLRPLTVLELSGILHLDTSLKICSILDKLETMPIDDLVIRLGPE